MRRLIQLLEKEKLGKKKKKQVPVLYRKVRLGETNKQMRFFQGRNDIPSRPRFARLVNRIRPFRHVHVPPTTEKKKAGEIKEKKKKNNEGEGEDWY